MPSLEALIPEVTAYQQARGRGIAEQGAQLNQVGALQQIMQRQQQAQEQQQLKGMLSQAAQQSGGDPAKMHQLLLQSGNPAAMKLAQGLEGHLDRKAKLESDNLNRDLMRQQRLDELTQRGEQEIAKVREQAAQNRITKEEADKREAVMREQMARLAASLRPAPQVQPLVPIVGPDGKPRLVERKDAVGAMPAATGAKAEAVEAGKSEVDNVVVTLKSALDSLNEGGGITSTDKGVLPNTARWASTTGPGQLLGTMGGTINQKNRDVISQARPLLMRSIMQATGMSAKAIDSNAELKLWLSTATDPTKSYEANIEALNNIASKYGSGGFSDGGQTAAGKIKKGRRADDVPDGIDPKVWAVMKPEEKKLFKQ